MGCQMRGPKLETSSRAKTLNSEQNDVGVTRKQRTIQIRIFPNQSECFHVQTSSGQISGQENRDGGEADLKITFSALFSRSKRHL
jgi:hypothetical protein